MSALLLILPLLFCRFFYLKRYFFQIYGILQDAFLVTALLALPPYLHYVFFPILYFLTLFDGYLFAQTSLRLEPAFFIFFKDGKAFWDSAKEKGISLFMPQAAIAIFYPLLVLELFHKPISKMSVIISGAFALGTLIFTPMRQRYYFYHIFFLLFKRLYEWFFEENAAQEFDRDPDFLPKCEKFEWISPEYPHLKYTKKFYGEKLFDLQHAKGEKPHLIFLYLESFRRKDVGALTPHFSALCQEGIYFPNYYAGSVKTSLASLSSLFGIPSNFESLKGSVDPLFPLISLAHIMKRNGYQTSYQHNGLLQFENKLSFFSNNGFDHFVGKHEIHKKYSDAPMISSWGMADEYLMNYSVDWLSKQTKPSFLTMFTVTNHHPWIAPQEHEGPDISPDCSPSYQRYQKTMHYTDHCLKLFLEELEKKHLLDRSVIFIMGDHGQPMGEHDGNFIEQIGLYEENIHVPLLIYAKNRIDAPKVIEDVASQVDLLPTVMDLMDLKGVNHSVGTSLRRKVSGRRAYFHNPFAFGYLGMREGDYKGVYTKDLKKLSLYHLGDDPEEKKNLASEEEERSKHFKEALVKYRKHFSAIYKRKAFAPKSPPSQLDFSSDSSISPRLLMQKILAHPHLIELNLKGYLKLTGEMFQEIFAAQPQLRLLNLEDCSTLGDESLFHLVKSCPKLQYLNLSGCHGISETTVSMLINELSQLEELFANQLSLSDAFVQAIHEPHPRLFKLKLEGDVRLSEKSLERLAQLFPNLQELRISCRHFTKEGLNRFAQNCSDLSHIYLDHADVLSDEILKNLISQCPSIERLFIHRALQITEKGLAHLKKTQISRLHLGELLSMREEGLYIFRDIPCEVLVIERSPHLNEMALKQFQNPSSSLKFLKVNGKSFLKMLG